MPTALVSVSDKTGLEPFARSLVELGYQLIATGGTQRLLEGAGLPVTAVSSVTKSPEMLGGRVKTLHPRIHAGILATRTPEQMEELSHHGIDPIDMVVANLYPFRETIAKPETELAEALETIDIGGPTMLRAAAKNFPHVLVVVDPKDYPQIIAQLQAGSMDAKARAHLATKAFHHTSSYDAAISQYLQRSFEVPPSDEQALPLQQVQSLRYGENPHQEASLWRLGAMRGPVLDAEIIQGKAMSFNNYADADAAWTLLQDLSQDAQITQAHSDTPDAAAVCVAIKHTNPSGVARAATPLQAYQGAHAADPVSIFGGIVALNTPIDAPLAEEMAKTFLEIILAPGYSPEALRIFARKKNLRLLKVSQATDHSQANLRSIAGGILMQSPDTRQLQASDLTVVSQRQPTSAERQDLYFAWTVCKHSKSNAIVLAKDGVTTGIGLGQVSRIWAAEQAIDHAGEHVAGSVLASDAFFPFDDVVRAAAAAGVQAIISPGGSKRDAEVIAACDALGVSMVFTGVRHFKH